MKNAFFTVVCLMSIFMLASCSLFAPAPFPIDIHVVDEHGNPIPHAIVKKEQDIVYCRPGISQFFDLPFYPDTGELGITDKNGYIRYKIDMSNGDWIISAYFPNMENSTSSFVSRILKDPQYKQALEKNKKLDLTLTMGNMGTKGSYQRLFENHFSMKKSPEFLKQEQALKQKYFKIMKDIYSKTLDNREFIIRENEDTHLFAQEEIDSLIPPSKDKVELTSEWLRKKNNKQKTTGVD